jgi:hypothetical protein
MAVLLEKPGTKRKRSALWLPRSARATMHCFICGAEFLRGDERAYANHVRDCGTRYAATESPKVKMGPLVDPAQAPDPELESWVARNAEQIIEGRKKM